MKIGKLVFKKKRILLAMTCSILLIIGYLLIYNVNGEPNEETTLPRFGSEDGTIKITMRNTAATSGYRWGTVGWAITRKPIPETSNGGIKDYDAKRDGERIIILYEDGMFTNSKGKSVKPCKKQEGDNTSGGKTETYYEFDEEYVLDKLNISLPNLKKKETLYLHGVFVTYKLNENGTREYYQDLSNSREYIYNWKEIRDYVFPGVGTWSKDSTRADFAKYFNIKFEYEPNPQPMKVIYEFECENTKYSCTVAKNNAILMKGEALSIGDNFSYTAEKKDVSCPLTKLKTDSEKKYYDGRKFTFQKMKVTSYRNQSTYIARDGTDYTKTDTGDKLKLSAKVPAFGLTFVLTYKEVPQIPIYYRRLYGKVNENGAFDIKAYFQKATVFGSTTQGGTFTWDGSKEPKITEQFRYKKDQYAEPVTGQVGDDIYNLFGYYLEDTKGNKRPCVINGKKSVTLQQIMNGSIKNVKEPMIVNFLYEKSAKHPIKYVREMEDGTVLEKETLIDTFFTGETYKWSVKSHLYYNSKQNAYKEASSAKDDSYLELVKVKVVNRKDDKVLKQVSCSGKSSYSGSFEVESMGEVIHYIYRDKHPVSYMRETEDGEIIENETNLGRFHKGESYTWSVKSYLKYDTTKGNWKELTNNSDVDYQLVKVKFEYLKDHAYKNETSCSGKTSYTGSFNVPSKGVLIHYVYRKKKDLQEPVSYQRETVDGVVLQGDTSLGSYKANTDFTWKVGAYLAYDKSKGTCKELTKEKGSDYKLVKVKFQYLKENTYKKEKKCSGSSSYTGGFKVPEGGLRIHYVYEKLGELENTDDTSNPVYYQRELEDGTIIQDKTLIDKYEENSECLWGVKAYLSYNNTTGTCEERTIQMGTNLALVRVKIANYKDASKSIEDMRSNGQSTYSGSFKVPKGGALIRYIYHSDGTLIEIPEESIPEPDSKSGSYEVPEVNGVIKADNRGNEKFNVEDGIPTTESLYVQVKGTRYLLGYTFTKKVGKVTYNVPVSIKHSLKWTSAKGKAVIEDYTQSASVPITRTFGYWEISRLDYYTIDGAEVYNYTLPNGKVSIQSNSVYNRIPSLAYRHSESQKDHVMEPSAIAGGRTIELPGMVQTGGKQKPSKAYYSNAELKYMVDAAVGKSRVKNDYLVFDGKTVIPDSIFDGDAGTIDVSPLVRCEQLCEDNCLYKPDCIIDAIKLNGSYTSSGTIKYRKVESVHSIYNDNDLTFPVEGLNSVTLHTPVLCNPIVTGDNDRFVQLISPHKEYLQLVLDPNSLLNDFTVHISNTGFHNMNLGYTSRDFSYNLYDGPTISNQKESYIQKKNGILRNELKFPFDVYMHHTDNTTEFVPKDTWIVIGRSTVTFHIPMWVNEGLYTVDCRTVAVNCTDDFMKCMEELANRNRFNYVVTNSFKVEVSGRIYGLNIYDMSDYPIWENVFRENDSLEFKINHKDKHENGTNKPSFNDSYFYNYTAGIKNQYGIDTDRLSKFTFPLVNGNHPLYNNEGILKKGYGFRFSLETIGNMYANSCKVVIKPTFYHVDENGQNRQRVDLYYDADIDGSFKKLVKIGGALDSINLKQVRTGDPYLGIPESELKDTAILRSSDLKKYVTQTDAMYSYNNIRISSAFRTFTNQAYRFGIMSRPDASKVIEKGIKSTDIDIRKQTWYAEYMIPGNARAVPYGFDVTDYAKRYGVDDNSSIWLKDGYIIVNFNIYTLDQDGKAHLSYTNAENYLNNGHCCMWSLEGYQLQKTDSSNKTFSFKIGDVMIYDSNQKKGTMNSDYRVGGTH